jgi:hypothetical protein
MQPTTTNIDTNKIIKHYLNLTSKGHFPEIIFNNISTKQIENVISSLHSKNSSGYNEISTYTLEISATYIASPLSYIFNKAVLEGKFPSRVKYSIVTPIYEKGDKKNCANFRPISLLTSLPNVFEK